MPRLSRVGVGIVTAGLCLSLFLIGKLTAQQTPARPTFRAGIDAIPLDVLVLDKNRHPVRGLTQAEFTILENGKPQPIISFGEVDVAGPVTPPAPWMREVAPDVVSNEMRNRRLVVLVMDNGNTGVSFGEPRSVRRIAHAVIDQLGPDDLAAVIYTHNGRPQNFTADQKKLRLAIEAFQPLNLKLSGRGPGLPLACDPRTGIRYGGCAVDALKHIGDFLRTALPGRKTLIYVSPGVAFDFSPFGANLSPQILALQDMFQALQLANVSVYAIDPVGLQPAARDPNVLDFAENTGGRSIRNDNEPWLRVPDVFRENSSYYLLGYQSTNPMLDGGFRRIEVKVSRPGVEVRSRSGYYARTLEKSKPSKSSLSAIDEALARGLPGGDMPLRVSAAAFGLPGRREADLAVVVGVRELMDPIGAEGLPAGGPPDSRRLTVITTAFDANWVVRGSFKQLLELTMSPKTDGEPQYEVLSRLSLRPGRYEVRVAAESGGRTASVFLDVDVPDFGREDLSVSGLVLERRPPSRMATTNVLETLIPVVPTTIRAFAQADRVTAFLRVYQGGKHELLAPTIAARIIDSGNRTVSEESARLSAVDFSSARAADYRLELPLSRLAAGEHLLTIDVAAGKRVFRRDVRFSVK